MSDQPPADVTPALEPPMGRVYPSMGEAVAAAMDNNIRNAEAYRAVVADRRNNTDA